MVDPTAHHKSPRLSPRTIPAPIGSFIDHRPTISILKNLIVQVAVLTVVATNTDSRHTMINGITPTAAHPTYKVSILKMAITKIVATSSNTKSTLHTIPTMPSSTLNNLVSGTTLLHLQLVVLLPQVAPIFPTPPSMPRTQRNSADKRNTAVRNMPILNRIITELFRPLRRTSMLPMPRAIPANGLPPRPLLSTQDHLPGKISTFSTVVS